MDGPISRGHEAERAEADAGRFLLSWVREAGFVEATFTSSTWTFADPETCHWWGELWAERVEATAFAEQSVEYGLSGRAELAQLAQAWRTWSEAENATFIVVHGEVLARR
ncbi:MAG: hypothetical protein WKF43_01375 [Acidimicrobiales bacterium]